MLILKKFLSSFIAKCQQAIITLMHLQVFITLCSLPLISYWGLPFSALSPLGNLLFAPYMSIYLCLSLAIFMSELLFIPNTFLIFLHEKCIELWLWLLSFGGRSCLLAIPKVNAVAYAFLILCAILILQSKVQSIFMRLLLYCCLCITCFVYIHYTQSVDTRQLIIPCAQKTIILQTFKGTHCLCTFDALHQRGSEKFTRFELASTLYNHGYTMLPFVVASIASSNTYRSLGTLISLICVKKIFVTKPKKKFKKLWQSWHDLCAIAEKHQTKIVVMTEPMAQEVQYHIIKT